MTNFSDAHRIEFIKSQSLSKNDRELILQLINLAFEDDLTTYFNLLFKPVHFIIRDANQIIGHACIVERWLQIGQLAQMRTSYIELAATHPNFQRQSIGSELMKAAVEFAEQKGFEICGLSPAVHQFYLRLGWELWIGPLFYRKNNKTFPSPADEEAMIYRLSTTPELDFHLPLSIEWRAGSEIW